ncbi:Zinc knuckle [Popillia japonica]|uniref:Zinc knuckle n=1 Tax=Popillia japonica TaxID=7064 RepID=A0AAW1JYQ3_POPJA
MKDRVHSWSELVNELRLQFQPPDYNEKLFREIRQRTQGKDESIGIYLAVIMNMFKRLSTPVTESVKLKIVLQNMLPYYQEHLSLIDVKSLDHLLELGRKLEARKITIDSYTPPPKSKNNLVEPDLAYVDISPSSRTGNNFNVAEIRASTSSEPLSNRRCWNCNGTDHLASRCTKPLRRHCFTNRRCWNCNGTDHLASRCTKPLRRHCFTCGRADVTRFTCPNCKPRHQGNGSGRR